MISIVGFGTVEEDQEASPPSFGGPVAEARQLPMLRDQAEWLRRLGARLLHEPIPARLLDLLHRLTTSS